MTTEETKALLECLMYEDCTVRLYGKIYWCCGITHDLKTGTCAMSVFEIAPVTREWVRGMFDIEAPTADECMNHFIEDKFWDGKSFYEVASDMEFIDL